MKARDHGGSVVHPSPLRPVEHVPKCGDASPHQRSIELGNVETFVPTSIGSADADIVGWKHLRSEWMLP